MKIAVFGKPGGGKSTLSLQIAVATKLPLHQLDLVQYQGGGTKVFALRPAKRVYVVRKQSDVATVLGELSSWSQDA
jgi:broad-specificity NMP kinase